VCKERFIAAMIVYAVVDDPALSPDFPCGVESRELLIHRVSAELFIKECTARTGVSVFESVAHRASCEAC
jgi:hypothetical protein